MSKALEYRERDKSVLVTWSLPDLPTAQHKAGLAGLYVYVDKMPEFILGQNASIPIIESKSPLELSIRFTEDSFKTLMDSVYAGEKHLIEPKTEREKTKSKGEEIRPRADLIVHWRSGNPDDPWVNLWRKAMRGVLRKNRSAKIYDFTTESQSPTEKSRDLKELRPGLFPTAKKPPGTVIKSVPTSMFIGAEKKSAEGVDFKGEVRHNLLLHFWPFVSQIFIPREVQRKRKGKEGWECKDRGFVMAVPEVAHLEDFGKFIDAHWRRLQGPDGNGPGQRPRQSRIDTAVEGGMAFLHSLAWDRLDEMDDGDFFDAVPQVELYHLEKDDNNKNVRMLAAETVRLPVGILRQFDRIRDPNLNVQFKRLRLNNLLNDLPWHAQAAEMLFNRFPVELFIKSDKTPEFARNFGPSVKEQFRIERDNMSEQINIASKVYGIVGKFVAERAEKRSGVKRNEKANAYFEARKKVATDAFLAIRSRNPEEFVNYFIGSICAVPQFMGAEGISLEEGFIAISKALHESPTEMKNLTMLALCAHAWPSRPRAEEPNNTIQSE